MTQQMSFQWWWLWPCLHPSHISSVFWLTRTRVCWLCSRSWSWKVMIRGALQIPVRRSQLQNLEKFSHFMTGSLWIKRPRCCAQIFSVNFEYPEVRRVPPPGVKNAFEVLKRASSTKKSLPAKYPNPVNGLFQLFNKMVDLCKDTKVFFRYMTTAKSSIIWK